MALKTFSVLSHVDEMSYLIKKKTNKKTLITQFDMLYLYTMHNDLLLTFLILHNKTMSPELGKL